MCKVARGRVLRRTERKAPREAAPWRPERQGSEADSARRRGAWRNAGANPSGARRGGSSRGRAHTRATGQRRPSGALRGPRASPSKRRQCQPLHVAAGRWWARHAEPSGFGKPRPPEEREQRAGGASRNPGPGENKLRELRGNADVFGPTKTLSHRRTCLLKGKMKECCSK